MLYVVDNGGLYSDREVLYIETDYSVGLVRRIIEDRNRYGYHRNFQLMAIGTYVSEDKRNLKDLASLVYIWAYLDSDAYDRNQSLVFRDSIWDLPPDLIMAAMKDATFAKELYLPLYKKLLAKRQKTLKHCCPGPYVCPKCFETKTKGPDNDTR